MNTVSISFRTSLILVILGFLALMVFGRSKPAARPAMATPIKSQPPKPKEGDYKIPRPPGYHAPADLFNVPTTEEHYQTNKEAIDAKANERINQYKDGMSRVFGGRHD
jgi:hypothetical protein